MNEEQDLFEKTFDELWKIEEYNFGTTDEDGYHNFDDYTDYPFATEEMSTLADEYQKLKHQLQAYKDKEDKLREYMNTIDNWNYKKLEGRTNQINRNELLQILNEGGKE